MSKYNLKQLKGAFGAGYATKTLEIKTVRITFDELQYICFCSQPEAQGYSEFPEGYELCNMEGNSGPIIVIPDWNEGNWKLCNEQNCPLWKDWSERTEIPIE